MAREALAERSDAVLLMLDSLQDPQNLGTISRTAEATGVGGIITSHNRSPEVTPSVVKASAGGARQPPLACVANTGPATRPPHGARLLVGGLPRRGPTPLPRLGLQR